MGPMDVQTNQRVPGRPPLDPALWDEVAAMHRDAIPAREAVERMLGRVSQTKVYEIYRACSQMKKARTPDRAAGL